MRLRVSFSIQFVQICVLNSNKFDNNIIGYNLKISNSKDFHERQQIDSAIYKVFIEHNIFDLAVLFEKKIKVEEQNFQI